MECNLLRNLLECSAPVTLTAELDLITRALENLSRQLLFGRPSLTSSDLLITPLQGRCLLGNHSEVITL